MSDFMSALPEFLGAISDFLMAEPICYFVGIMVLCAIAGLVKYIMFGRS